MKEEGQQHQKEETDHHHGREQIELEAEAEIGEKNAADRGQHHHGGLHLGR